MLQLKLSIVYKTRGCPMQQFAQRLNDLLRANAHHAIDQMEEPERMLKQYLRELDQEIRDIRLQLAKAVAGEKRLQQQAEGLRKQMANLAGQAAAALEEGEEDLARAALDRKFDLEESAQSLEDAHRQAARSVAEVRQRLGRSETQREQARHTRVSLVARYRAAATLHSMGRANPRQGFNSTVPDPGERIADLAERIADFEATAHGLSEICAMDHGNGGRLEQAERKRSIERELETLKSKMRGGK
jgi:phage shock protein A